MEMEMESESGWERESELEWVMESMRAKNGYPFLHNSQQCTYKSIASTLYTPNAENSQRKLNNFVCVFTLENVLWSGEEMV